MSARARGAAWLLTRLLLLALLLGGESRVVGDVVYFSHSLRDLSDLGWAHTLPEYPLPAVLVVGIPWVLAMPFGLPGPFGFVLVACVLAVDAAFTALLLRSPRRPRRDTAFWVWLLGMPALRSGRAGPARPGPRRPGGRHHPARRRAAPPGGRRGGGRDGRQALAGAAPRRRRGPLPAPRRVRSG